MYWSFSFSISPSNEYSGSISFRIDWFDLLAVQGTFKSLLQHHSSKVSILQCSAFFMVQISHPYMTTGKPYVITYSLCNYLRVAIHIEILAFLENRSLNRNQPEDLESMAERVVLSALQLCGCEQVTFLLWV